MSGYLYIAGYILFRAYSFVLAFSLDGHRSDHVVIFFATLLSILFFYGLQLLQHRTYIIKLHQKIKKNWPDVVGLNLSYGIGWLAALYSLRYISPATMLTLSMVTIPIITFILKTRLRDYPKNYPTLLAILCIIVSMVIILQQNFYAMEEKITIYEIILGTFFACLDGVSGAFNGLFSEKLTKKKLAPSAILAFRFFFLLCITGFFAFIKGDFIGLPMHLIPTFLQASILMMIMPRFLYQKALSALGSIVVSTLLPFIPIFAYGIQVYQGSYPFNGFILVALLICSIALITMEVVIDKQRRFRKKLALEFKKGLKA